MSDLYTGLMSGSSLDGIDGVLADFSPPRMRVLQHASAAFAPALRAQFKRQAARKRGGTPVPEPAPVARAAACPAPANGRQRKIPGPGPCSLQTPIHATAPPAAQLPLPPPAASPCPSCT